MKGAVNKNGDQMEEQLHLTVDLPSLVKQAQARQPEALGELLWRFAPLLSKWQRRLSAQWPHEEEGVLHSQVRFAFVMLVIEFDAGRGVPFEGYVCRLIARRLADQCRREWCTLTLTFSEVASVLGMEHSEVMDWWCASPVLSGATLPPQDECWCRLWWQEAVTQLTPRQLAVMKLILQGHTEREIALVLGIQQTTVHQSKQEAQKKLQEFWR